MPCVTYLSDNEIEKWQSVPDDKDVDELLKEFRAATGENWLVGVHKYPSVRRLFRKPLPIEPRYTLYADCHGEWQVMNLCGREGGSVFGGSAGTREQVMNYMLGYIGGLQHKSKGEAQ